MLRPSARRSLILVLGGLTLVFVALNFATFLSHLPDCTTWCDSRATVEREVEVIPTAPDPVHMDQLREEMARVEVEMRRVEEELRSVEREQIQAALERAREALGHENLNLELRVFPELQGSRAGKSFHFHVPENALHIN